MRDNAIRTVRVMHRVPNTVGSQLRPSGLRVDWGDGTALNVDCASPRFGSGRLFKPVTVCGWSDSSGSDDGRFRRLGFQPCNLFLQSCDLVAKFALSVLTYYELYVRLSMQDSTNLSQTFIRFLLLQLSLEQRDLAMKLCIGTACLLQLAPDTADFGVRVLCSFLPLNSSLLSLCQGLSNGGHRPIEVDNLGFLVLEATLEVVVISFQGSCAIVIIPQVPQFLVIGFVDLAREELYLFSSAVHLFPSILLREKAVALLSDRRGGLFGNNLVASGDGDVEFKLMDLRYQVRKSCLT